MRRETLLSALFAVLPLTACAQESSTSQEGSTPSVSSASIDARLSKEPVADTQKYAAKSYATKSATSTSLDAKSQSLIQSQAKRIPATGPTPISCKGIVKQGGLVVCKTEPNAKVKIARAEDDFYYETANGQGLLFIGFDRDETSNFVEYAGDRVQFDFDTRDYDISRIDGLPKNMVSEYSEEELKRIRRASALKKEGFASRVEEIGFKDGFILPIQEKYIKTTNFGAQRILNGDPKRPHYGVDLAAPKGTPIVAPADGIVSLASEEMYFEGSLIMIDHGQGLISYYLHNEDVFVENGQVVKQGEKIATVGSKGRSTGPHLCWRLKWRNRNLDPELMTQWKSES